MTAPVAESGEVTQVDREAAANLLGGATPEGLLDGRQDTLSVVRTLARHRLASYEAGRAEGVRAAAEVADQIARFAKHKGLCAVVGGYGYCDCGRDAAVESLRALSKEPAK